MKRRPELLPLCLALCCMALAGCDGPTCPEITTDANFGLPPRILLDYYRWPDGCEGACWELVDKFEDPSAEAFPLCYDLDVGEREPGYGYYLQFQIDWPDEPEAGFYSRTIYDVSYDAPVGAMLHDFVADGPPDIFVRKGLIVDG